MSDIQIRQARRFVSGFCYKTDATFNTNNLNLPLTVMVGIDNTGCTFPIGFVYITTESAKSFQFIDKQLTDLVFYDCPKPQVIIGDFTKGLSATISKKAIRDKIESGASSSKGKGVTPLAVDSNDNICEDTIVVDNPGFPPKTVVTKKGYGSTFL
jgi:hypothetical protein